MGTEKKTRETKMKEVSIKKPLSSWGSSTQKMGEFQDDSPILHNGANEAKGRLEKRLC